MSDHPDPDATDELADAAEAGRRGYEAGLSMKDALAAADAIAELIRNDPMTSVHLAIFDAELQHRGMQGPRPRRWWRRICWVLRGRRRRRLESPPCDSP